MAKFWDDLLAFFAAEGRNLVTDARAKLIDEAYFDRTVPENLREAISQEASKGFEQLYGKRASLDEALAQDLPVRPQDRDREREGLER